MSYTKENAAVQAQRDTVPRRYWIWLGGVTLSLLGSQIMAFGMTWVAAGWGGAFAGAVLTAINLPRVALLLFGGALADRIGAWRVMITSDLTMAAATVVLGAAVLIFGVQPWLLLAAALVIGVVDAFYLPSSGSMPRRLVSQLALARAMSARQAIGQLATFVGPSMGGLVVATAGLATAVFLNTATFVVMAVILIGLRPRSTPADAPPPADGSVLRRSASGLRVAWSDPLLRPALGLIAAAAGFLLPVSGLLIPLLATQRQWSAVTGGILAGTIALGIVVVAVTVTAAGAFSRPGVAAAGGLALAAAAVLAMAAMHTPVAAVAVAALVGIGSGVFTTHVGPLILGGTPSTHLARVQSVLVLAQSLPLLLTNNVLGSLNDLFNVNVVLAVCSVFLLLAAVLGLRSPVLRTATLAQKP
ncbi:MFS transporter [Micromonospora sp. C31]|uniref:MFS transporter n=1 Tax=Micromonospora sp. C31 TaxID=2824876 RepID=UPI001B369C41|nr:MFS transporter [Micromonospora sp. C31]MBQ1076786.1 MFS transporter [Micromonospora sp. C31]